ncbi:hypothetical protein [Duganella levis]|uniref:Uncharacterized protein n=1 Tax=Duganella levis TaxID=2692169 RepID=A0ABW9VYA0_9BURK|nr:hypothetical protein [Duganella levis]MYN26648.1 hypothetical protein [Duganella levis]
MDDQRRIFLATAGRLSAFSAMAATTAAAGALASASPSAIAQNRVAAREGGNVCVC